MVEIVSKPDITSPEEAYAYLETLRQIVQFTGASDVKMEEGSMRVDTNLSVRPIGQKHFGTKTEIKNLNSFVHVRDGLAYEEKRQQAVLLSGGEVRQETRRWDPDTKETILMRVKEGADDYRYFPNRIYRQLRFPSSGLMKCRQRCHSHRQNGVSTTLRTGAFRPMMPAS